MHAMTKMPRLVFKLGLTAEEMGVYGYLKANWNDEVIKHSEYPQKMGITKEKYIEILKSLKKPREILGGNSLISLQFSYDQNGKLYQTDILITDIWEENYKYFKGKK